jgi:Uma2 family endonuclease
MSTVADVKLLTIDEFLQLPADDLPTELVRGKVVKMNPPYGYHGYVCANLVRIIGNFVDESRLGRIFTCDSGIVTHRNPDSLRGADVSFVSYSRFPAGPMPQKGYLDAVPELVFEVLSPSDRWGEILAKTSEYLTAGVTVVCLVDPKTATAMVYRGEDFPQTFDNGDILTIPDVLPGFQVPVRQIFN